MSNGYFKVEMPKNEPVKAYLPGSPERASLKKELERQSAQVVQVPMIIGGKEVWTERKTKAVMPHGTTTVIADPHELVNVKGNEAMEYILDAAGDAPLGIYVMMPSSIPATPFETNGADFTAEDMKQWKDHPLVLGLGEVMCYPAVLSKEEQIMKKLELCKGMVIDGGDSCK